MHAARLPSNEALRLRALEEYAILDTAADPLFDDIAAVASIVCEAPIALVSLIDTTRQWFKARVGLGVAETPRELAFCAHTILSPETMIVTDAQQDGRFAGNPLVTGDPFIRFYAGAPLITPNGSELGSLCVIDRTPRTLTGDQLKALEALSRQVVALLEARRVSAQLAEALRNVRTLGRLLPMCAWCKRVRDGDDYWQEVEAYIEAHTDSAFSHGICEQCAMKTFAAQPPAS